MSNPDSDSNSNSENASRIQALATNVNEMISTIQHIHGAEYANKLTAVFALTEQLDQLESIACEATSILRDNSGENITLHKAASAKHDASHILADGIRNAVKETIKYFASLPGYESFNADFKSLKERADHDWHSHNH